MVYETLLPIKPHLKKLIAKKFEVDPFRIELGSKNPYAGIIYGTLRSEIVNTNVGETSQKFSDRLHILVPESLCREKRFYWEDKHVVRINSAILGIFEDKLYTFLDLTCTEKTDIQRNIIKFMDMYGITEEDITYEGLKKSYYKHRVKSGNYDPKKFTTRPSTKKLASKIKDIHKNSNKNDLTN